jgi:hypothetical protein
MGAAILLTDTGLRLTGDDGALADSFSAIRDTVEQMLGGSRPETRHVGYARRLDNGDVEVVVFDAVRAADSPRAQRLPAPTTTFTSELASL